MIPILPVFHKTLNTWSSFGHWAKVLGDQALKGGIREIIDLVYNREMVDLVYNVFLAFIFVYCF